ncbi:MAG: deoxyuridine 5'-triphosphate nucleotidohydrolase [Nitrososphaeria archaeon]
MSVLTGEDVAKYVEGVCEDQIQPNGVDLTIHKLFKIVGRGQILKDRVVLPEYVEVSPNDEGFYILNEGTYIFQVRERIIVPLNAVGFCLPRSSLVRLGAYIGAALWDSGYSGFSRILLKVNNPIVIEKGARIVQFILIRSKNVRSGYKGRYQNK